jgi:hypothetical protein
MLPTLGSKRTCRAEAIRNLATGPAFDQYVRLIDWGRCLGAAGRGYRGVLAGAGKRSERHLAQFAAARALEINAALDSKRA